MSRFLPNALALLSFLAVGTPLTAQDAPQPEQLFDTLDADDDGTLSADEIGEPQRQAFERLLRLGDVDEDGSLTRNEYLKAFQPGPGAGADPSERTREPGREGRPQRPDFGRLFEMADRDRDGKVALGDLPEPLQQRMRPLYERLGKQELTRDDFERAGRMASARRPDVLPQRDDGGLFDRLDKDANGSISREDLPQPLRQRFESIFERIGKQELNRSDFQRVLRNLRSDEPFAGDSGRSLELDPGVRLPPLAQMLDADRDGQLSMAEIESLQAKFRELDTNGDGKLVGAELKAFADRLTPRGASPPDVPRDQQPPRSRADQPQSE